MSVLRAFSVRLTRVLFSVALAWIVVSSVALAESPSHVDFNEVDFNNEVRPILVKHCLACHGGVKQAGGLSFVSRDLAMADGDSGAPVIEPDDADASYLFDRVIDPDDEYRMPPPEHGRRLNTEEVATLRRWIDQGADWDAPWAFQPPSPPPVPEAAASDWSRQPLDAFVLKRLQSEGLAPAEEADRAQWLRRVSFDLTGLPPTEAERLAFENDRGAEAYERVVDRLLASPHFGERWASVWLDLARYADTMGFEKDPNRTIWPWRDWVVRAFNDDLPYNEFLLKQTAGDLLPDATLGDRLATALHRNTPTNTEGGTDDEEYRWAAVVDRVDSTWAGVLGLTMGCARCHDHPYDPISQADYYRFAAFFNTTQDADLAEDWPKLRVPTDHEQWDEAQRLHEALHSRRADLAEQAARLNESTSPWRPLAIDRAESTGETRLRIDDTPRGAEVVTAGTVTDRSLYTLTASTEAGRLTALRIDASPKDPARAATTPEMGFVLSNLRLFVERADSREAPTAAKATEVFFAEVLADEANGFFQPIDSIRDNTEGWGAYTRIRKPRWAVFVLAKPIELAEGDRLRVVIKHGKATDGQGPLVIQRLRVSSTDDDAWTELIESPAFRESRREEEKLAQRLDKIPSTPTPVLVQQPADLRRQTHRLDRGNWLSPAEKVTPALPAKLPGTAPDRLALGRWFGSEENPLTARVMVNRLWAELFGGGLIETLDDFGSTGTEPSHPELLDHLAVRFRSDLDWSLKRLLREMVLSATYRQDARTTPEQAEADPTNRLLARGPRGRLSAEMIRDQALVFSGRFSPRLGGPPVMPYQPEGVWQTIYNNSRWETADGEDRFRRALYTFWKRTAAYPSLMAFDAPSREQCTVRRPTTNTPLQALVTLNDPAFIELAEGLADRMLARDESTNERITWAMHLATGQAPAEASVAELVQLHDEIKAEDERLAMTLVANVILNLDATLTK